ncbi:HAD family hydrolase [Dokdonella soli]|uniref:HAD family hydrolase n=1 Tax=Dokdonella soli TaxID=529810 RepID=A0ABN1IWS7_9GAMM
MLTDSPTVFLLDVDNTLLDNDRFTADLGERLQGAFGSVVRDRYWAIFASQRKEAGYADYLAALQALRLEIDETPDLLRMSTFLLEYPFAERLYPDALAVIAHLGAIGRTVVYSDGDIVFQPRKIQRSGIWAAVEGRVLIPVHKERALASMQRNYPASHYVMFDDKPQLLAAMKRSLGDRLTTVFVRQGHYAQAPDAGAADPAPDTTLAAIGDALGCGIADFAPVRTCA